MWVMTPHGYFSAVQHSEDDSLLVVRTRDHSDAEELRGWYEEWLAQPPEDASLPAAVIISYEVSDYPWRVILPRDAWGDYLAQAVEELDYGNFKAAVADEQGPYRAGVYGEVWGVLHRIQEMDPHHPEFRW